MTDQESQELDLTKRKAVLNQFYSIYDDFIQGRTVCCKKYDFLRQIDKQVKELYVAPEGKMKRDRFRKQCTDNL